MPWFPINTAPKDGQLILLLAAAYNMDCGPENGGPLHCPPKVALGKWWPEGDAWVDEHGQLGGEPYQLMNTGVWESGNGWFQPNEVTHWAPLPELP